jgi:hypothetical protein
MARRGAFAAFAGAAVVLGLTGCMGGPAAAPTPAPVPTVEPTPGSTEPAGPELRPGDTAAANQQFFDKVNTDFFAAHGFADGRSIVDNLIASGFRKQDMELTPDRTAIDLAADSIVFSVRVKGECLVGQFSAAGYRGVIAPLLGTGGCLVGTTRPIDW